MHHLKFLLWYATRVLRMMQMLVCNQVTFQRFFLALRPSMVSVQAKAGGMVFCDASDERDFFQ
jgi:hypothetical protein